MNTKKIAVDRDILANLTEILGVESEDEAFEYALNRLCDILEIEQLNALRLSW